MITTVLELVGLAFLVVALVVLLWPLAPAAGLAAGGVLTFGASWMIERRQ